MGMKRCFYGECRNSEVNTTLISFHRFPNPKKQPIKFKKWLEASGWGMDSIEKFDYAKTARYVCSKHFLQEKGPTKENPDPIKVNGKVVAFTERCRQLIPGQSLEEDVVSDLDENAGLTYEESEHLLPDDLPTANEHYRYACTDLPIVLDYYIDSNNSLTCINQEKRPGTVVSQEMDGVLNCKILRTYGKPKPEIPKDVKPVLDLACTDFPVDVDYTNSNNSFTCVGQVKRPHTVDSRETDGVRNNKILRTYGKPTPVNPKRVQLELNFINLEPTTCASSMFEQIRKEVGWPRNWTINYGENTARFSLTQNDCLILSYSIDDNLETSLRILGKDIPRDHFVMKDISHGISDPAEVLKTLRNLESFHVCPGNLKKDVPFLASNIGSGIYCFMTDAYHSVNCSLVFKQTGQMQRCEPCKRYRWVILKQNAREQMPKKRFRAGPKKVVISKVKTKSSIISVP